MTRLPRGSVLAITLPVLLWATGAFASPPITFEFSGTSPDDPRTPAGIVTGSFTFDPAAAGIPDAVEPGSTHYPLISFSVTLGGQTVSTPTGSITVQNNPVFQAPSTDVYQVSADFGGVPFHSGSLSLLLITLADNGDTMFSDESLPLVPDFQNAAETRSGQFLFPSESPQSSFFENVALTLPATPITFEFSGTSPDDPRTPAGIVAGSFTFDPAAAGVPEPVDPMVTAYSLSSFSVTLGGQTVSTPTGTIFVQNDSLGQGSTDAYQVSADFGDVPFHSGSLSNVLISLFDHEDTMFSDQSLPLTPDFQNAAETRSGQFRFTSTPGLPQFSFFEDVVLAPLDTDDDGVPDEGGNAPCQTDQIEGCDDNCPFEPNRSGDDIQRDTDGDGTGDSCACGNVDRNERRDIFDALHIAQGTLSPPLITMIHPRACDADGNGTCDIFDALRVAQATLAPPLAEIVQECEAATVAPSTP